MAKFSIGTKKRDQGIYHTPWKTSMYMVESVLNHLEPPLDKYTFLDPCTGDGVFVEALLDQGIKKNQITAHDINPEAIETLKTLGVKSIKTDSLLGSYGTFDVIIGNPPYKSRRQSKYIKQNKEILETKFGKFSTLNLYVAFFMSALNHLKTGGILSFILQDSFLTNTYYKNFRKRILRDLDLIELLLAPRNLFHSAKADVRTVIFTAQKRSLPNWLTNDETITVRTIDRVKTEEEYKNPVNVSYVDQKLFAKLPESRIVIGIPEALIKTFLRARKKDGIIGNYFDGGTGISTGNDSKYLKKSVDKPEGNWIKFYRNPGGRRFYYNPDEWIVGNWKESANKDSNFMLRNSQYFYREGVTCSTMGLNFSAVYIPENCLFGINPTFFHEDKEYLLYLLGYLNSNIAIYFIRTIMNRTNMITSNYIKNMPFKFSKKHKEEVINETTRLYEETRHKNGSIEDDKLTKLNYLFFEIFGINDEFQNKITKFASNLYERV